MKSPTIAQLLQTIDAYNKAHELDLRHPPGEKRGPNPLLENLYFAAENAAIALRPLVKVELKTTPHE